MPLQVVSVYAAPVPKTVVFFWTGGPIPEQIRKNIKAWATVNSEYKFTLYVDSRNFLSTLKADELNEYMRAWGSIRSSYSWKNTFW